MKNAVINRAIIIRVAKALGEINKEVVYVGGATVGLYINDPAAEDARPTKDVDISLSLLTITELEHLRIRLINKGFTQNAHDHVICRFRYEDITVDVMNTKAIGWAPANRWFLPGFSLKEIEFIEGEEIQILPLAYFLASKFEAFKNRGNNEPRTSHDFEDIIYILDNRIDLVDVLQSAPVEVKTFLIQEFEDILNDKRKQEAIVGNLYFETRDERFALIISKIKEVIK